MGAERFSRRLWQLGDVMNQTGNNHEDSDSHSRSLCHDDRKENIGTVGLLKNPAIRSGSSD